MQRRVGWAALAGLAGLLFGLTAIGVSWSAGTSIAHHDPLGAAEAAGLGALTLVFWWWIALGAWNRYRPPIDPATGRPKRAEEPVGPWGIVGRVLVVVLVLAFVGGGGWLAWEARQATRAAEDVRHRAEREASRRQLTVADVDRARAAELTWAGDQEGPDPYDQLLEVEGAYVSDVSVDGNRAAILLRLPDSPPCVVVDIDADDLISTRLSNACT
ncbi:MAG: hypothetical protein R2746_10765 [Acidimicrobiales bacterium]